MRAVWSFWYHPVRVRGSRWGNILYDLSSWVLSVETTRQHYDECVLYADDMGRYILVDLLQLPFTEVYPLNVGKEEERFWALGKLHAFRQQEAPFFHIDSDVYLWKRLPERLENAPILVERIEDFYPTDRFSFYKPELVEHVIGDQGYLPEEWKWYRRSRKKLKTASCGIVGGENLDFFRYFTEVAIEFAHHPDNESLWSKIPKEVDLNVLYEQFLLCACNEYRNRRTGTKSSKVTRIEPLFLPSEDPFFPGMAAERGYTHVAARAKQNDSIKERLLHRVRRDYPDSYEKCLVASQLKESRDTGHY